MGTYAFRIASLAMLLLSLIGNSTPVRATSQTALTPPQTINIAHFFKPPNMDAATAVRNFSTMVLTNGDHVYRDQLLANGFTSTIPEYLRSDGIQDPGSCTATPANNQVAYNAGDFCFISQNHPDWFLLDQYGRRITVTSGGSYYRMDPANPGWREFFLTRVLESQQTNGWTGLFLDNVEGSLSKYYGPKPVKYPDNASYQAAIQGFLQYLYVNYSQAYGRPVIGNIVARDSDLTWFSYLQYLSGAMQERFAVDWDETSYLRVDRWNNDMAMMEQTQANGKYVILVAPGNQGDLNRQNFAFASYLLISNGKAAFRYSTDDAYNAVWLYDNYKVNLGNPLGPRYQVGSAWRRDFTRGCVIVDPASHQATIEAVGGKCMPASWAGGVTVSASSNIVAVGRPHIGNEITSYNGFAHGSQTMYVPMLFNQAYGGSYNAAFYVQNISSSQSAGLTIRYYDSNGSLNCTKNDTLPPFASKGYWLPDITCLPAGWVGGVVITSTQEIVAVGRPHIGNQVTSYNGFSNGSQSMYVPMLFKRAYSGDYNSALYVQNISTTNAAHLTMKYYDADGNLSCTKDETLAPLSSKDYWLPDEPCLPSSWAGGVIVNADQNIVAVGRPHIGSEITSYNGFPGGSQSMFIPMLFNKSWGGSYNAAFYIQNVNESNSADITIKYYNSNGTLNCTVNDTLAPLAAKGYWVPSQTCLPTGWVGGAVVSSNQEIVAVGRPHIGNQITSYDGFAAGNSSASIPMLFKNMWGSYNSAFYLQNVDATNSASVTLRFYDVTGTLVCIRRDVIAPHASLGYWLPGVSCAYE